MNHSDTCDRFAIRSYSSLSVVMVNKGCHLSFVGLVVRDVEQGLPHVVLFTFVVRDGEQELPLIFCRP